jgi:hypothetical protein
VPPLALDEAAKRPRTLDRDGLVNRRVEHAAPDPAIENAASGVQMTAEGNDPPALALENAVRLKVANAVLSNAAMPYHSGSNERLAPADSAPLDGVA